MTGKCTENGQNWSKIDRKWVEKFPKMAENDQQMTQMTENVQQLFENGP